MARTRSFSLPNIPDQFAITRRRTRSKTAAAASAAAQGSRVSMDRMTSEESSRRPSKDATQWMTANESIESCISIQSPCSTKAAAAAAAAAAKDATQWMTANESIGSCISIEAPCSTNGGQLSCRSIESSPCSTNGGSDMEMTMSSSSKMSGGAAWGAWSLSASASTTPRSQMSASGADMFRERGASKESCSPISRQTSKDSCRSSLLQLPSISPAFGRRAPSKESRSASKELTASQTRSGFKGGMGMSAPRRNTLNAQAVLGPTAGASLAQEPVSIVVPSGDMDMEKKRLSGQILASEDIDAEFEQIFSEAEVREWRIRRSSGEDWQKRLPGERVVIFSELLAKDLDLREAHAELKALKAELHQDRAQADLDWDELEDGEPADGDSKRFRKKATIIVAANDDDFEKDIDKKGPVVGAVVSRVRSKLSAMITMNEELRQPLAALQARHFGAALET